MYGCGYDFSSLMCLSCLFQSSTHGSPSHGGGRRGRGDDVRRRISGRVPSGDLGPSFQDILCFLPRVCFILDFDMCHLSDGRAMWQAPPLRRNDIAVSSSTKDRADRANLASYIVSFGTFLYSKCLPTHIHAPHLYDSVARSQ